MNNIIQNNFIREKFNTTVLNATSKAQKKYGFDMTQKEGAYSNTHNNEADAFKHAYMSWYLSFHHGDKISKYFGDKHENETPNAPWGERNMDLWNNAIGREIAYDMKQKLGEDYNLLGEEWLSDYASQKIWEKMQQGELITHPDDPRKYENMEIELLQEKDGIYSENEFKNFDEKLKTATAPSYMDYIVQNDWHVPSIKYLDSQVQKGDLIHVDNYIRSNGTRVSGYYRRRGYYKSKK